MAVAETDDAQIPHLSEIATFLVATAMVLRETVMRFEKTAARITESVTKRAGETDRDLIMTLQDFDRLQQEFVTLAEVLVQAAAKSGESWLRAEGGGHPAEDALAIIAIADLKERLMRHLGISMMDWAGQSAGDEAVF
jgi:hypothetical protein